MQSMESYAEFYGRELWSKIMLVPMNYYEVFNDSQSIIEIRESKLIQYPVTRIDFTFEESDEIELGRIKLKVMHLPGHCRGHCGFYWEAEEILFSSDIDFSKTGPVYANACSDIDDFIVDIKRLVELSPRLTVPAHGDIIEGSLATLAQRYVGTIYQREEHIIKLLTQPRTIEELSQSIGWVVKNNQNGQAYYWSKVMIYKHLTRLLKLGVIGQDVDTYYSI